MDFFTHKWNRQDLADRDFERVRQLSPDSDFAWIAAAQQALLSGNVQEAMRAAREGIRKGHRHYLLLTMLGEALLRAGATPATPAEFGEAQAALEQRRRGAARLLQRAPRPGQRSIWRSKKWRTPSPSSRQPGNSNRATAPCTPRWPRPGGAPGNRTKPERRWRRWPS